MGEIVFSKEYKIASGDQNYCGNDLCQDNQGNLVVCASRTYSPSSQAPTWLIKLNEWGDTLFTKTVALDGYVGGHQTIFYTGPSGFVVGTHMVVYPNAYAALFKVDTTFNLMWQSTFAGLGFSRFWNAIATNDEGFALIGTTWDQNNQAFGYLAKTDENGLLTGLEEHPTAQQKALYALEPNPLTDQNLVLNAYEGFGDNIQLELLSGNGQRVYHAAIGPQPGKKQLSIHLPALAKGLYLLQLRHQSQPSKNCALKLIIN
jgi:hypothetical protein